jgi:hypothetical protein
VGFRIADVIAAAGVGDPWERAGAVDAADAGAVTAMAAGFTAAAGHARTALAAAGRADPVAAASYGVDSAPVHDAPAAIAATRRALGDGGEHAEQISRMLTLVAAELAGTKSGVQGELADLGRELQAQSMAAARATAEAPPQTPADAAMAERALFARAVASVRAHGGRINVLLDDYDTVLASRAGTLANLGYAVPVPPGGGSIPPPPPAGSPQQSADWWRSLTREQQNTILATNPSLIGNRDGVPAHVRDAANRARLLTEAGRLDREIADTKARLAAAQQSPPTVTYEGVEVPNPQVRTLRSELAALTEQQAALHSVERTVGASGNRQLLLLDLDGHDAPRAAVAVGDVDTADHVAVFTPGLTSTVAKNLEGYTGDMVGVVQTSERLLGNAAGHESETVAGVAWIGYDAPQWSTLAEPDRSVALPIGAQHGGADLARFYDGINASRPDSDPHLTALGHSYGSTTTGYALQNTTTPVDDAVVFGSPGLGTSDAHDLHVPDGHLNVIEAKWDGVADLGAFGTDPNHLDGAHRLSAHHETADGVRLDESTGHSKYLTPNTASQYNISATVAGLYDKRIEGGSNVGFGDYFF